jgi:hypothetical protein
MENTFLLGAIIGPYFLVMGLSLLLYAKVWLKLMKDIEKNHTSVVIGMALVLLLGLAIIQMHNVWEMNIWVVITAFGWIAFFKGVFYFLTPGSWIKKIIKTFASIELLYCCGLTMTIIGAWMSYLVYIA